MSVSPWCQVLSLDALDMSGKHEVNIGGELHKERISATGHGLTLVPISAQLELTLPLSAQLRLTLSPKQPKPTRECVPRCSS
jgi:hypothetical protein